MAGIFLKSLILNHFRSYKKEALLSLQVGLYSPELMAAVRLIYSKRFPFFLQVEVCENPKILKTLVSLRIMAGRYRELLKG